MRKFKLKKKEKSLPQKESIVEPTRRSVFDVLQANLKLAKRTTYLHRLMYMGEHKYPQDEIADATENLYKLTNSVYHPEPLSGILLYYTNFFCCIVEGSERALASYAKILVEKECEYTSNVKILAIVHHIKSRFNDGWLSYFAYPPQRVEDIDEKSNLDESMRYLTDCCEKLYNFANAFVADINRKAEEEAFDNLEESDQRLLMGRDKTAGLGMAVRDPYARHLPEIKLLSFLCKCKYLEGIQRYTHYYQFIGQSKDFACKVWPAPKNFTRYDIFDEPYDPITDLPQLQGVQVHELKDEDEEDADSNSFPETNT